MQFIKGLVKNSIIFFAAQLSAKILTFVILIYIARVLGVSTYGKFAFAYALMNMFWIIARFGLESLITRDVAQNSSKAARYLGDTLQIHAYLGLLALGMMMVTLTLFHKSPETNLLVFFLGVAMIFNSMAESFTYTFASQERFDYQSALLAASQILTFILVFAGLQAGWSLIWVGGSFAGAAVIYFILSWRLCANVIVAPLFVWDVQALWLLMRKAVPFMVASIFVGVYYRIDVLILSVYATDQVVGWYDAAYNFVWALKLLPASMAAVLLPMLSKIYLTDREKTIVIYRKAVKYVSLMAVPAVLFVFIWAELLVTVMFGADYHESALVLRWLVWATAIMFVNAQQGTILIVTGREKQLLWATATGAVSNVGLNFILIPYFGMYGAAATTILSELVVGILCFRYSNSFIPLSCILKDVLAPFLFLLLMVTLSVFTKLSPITTTIIVFSSGIIILLAFSIIPKDDIRLFRAILRPKSTTV